MQTILSLPDVTIWGIDKAAHKPCHRCVTTELPVRYNSDAGEYLWTSARRTEANKVESRASTG